MRTSATIHENATCGIGEKREPIKRHPGLKQLSRDHHFALLLIWKIRQGLKAGIEAGRIGSYLLFFYRQSLKAHFQEEEKMLFPKLPENDVMRNQAIAEHKRIDLLASFITSDMSNADLLVEFADALEKHIRFEERSLFNYLQNALSELELDTLLRVHPEERSDVDEEWVDHFWDLK